MAKQKKGPQPQIWWKVYIIKGGKRQFIRRTRAVSDKEAVTNVWFTEYKRLATPEQMDEVKALRATMSAVPLENPKPPAPYRPSRVVKAQTAFVF